MSTMAHVRDCAMRQLCQVQARDLLHHQGRMCRISKPSSFVPLASWLREEMPVRFSHQLMEYYRLPYMVWGSQPFVTVHDAHLRAFEALSGFKKIQTEQDVVDFAALLRFHLQDTDSIGSFRSGFDELQRHGFSAADLKPLHPFLDKFIVTRIGNQVLANHFLDGFDCQLSEVSQSENVTSECLLAPMLVRTAEQVCNVATRIYGVRPEVQFEDALDTKVLVIPSHVQFIFREVLKNAVTATLEQHASGAPPPPVQVSIRPGKFDVDLRVSDQGGGMRRHVLDSLLEYGSSGSPWPPMASAFAGDAEKPDMHMQMSGYGMGIPLSKHYARFFGGDLHFNTIYGFGTDVSIRLLRLFGAESSRGAVFGGTVDLPGRQEANTTRA